MILFLILALILPVLSRAIIKINGYSSYDRGFFNQCVTCTLIPKNGIKTHQCNKTKETFKIDTPVNCVTENSTSSFSFLLYQASVVYLSLVAVLYPYVTYRTKVRSILFSYVIHMRLNVNVSIFLYKKRKKKIF